MATNAFFRTFVPEIFHGPRVSADAERRPSSVHDASPDRDPDPGAGVDSPVRAVAEARADVDGWANRPIIWHEGDGFYIRDPYGNQWIDFSAGVLVASMGYGHPRVIEAMRRQLETGLYHTYCFANEPRIELVEKLAAMAPPPLEKVFLLSTGSEATECAMKLARTYATPQGTSREGRTSSPSKMPSTAEPSAPSSRAGGPP